MVSYPVEVCALLYVWEHDQSREIMVWDAFRDIPYLESTSELANAINVTNQLIAFMAANIDFVPEGWDADDRDWLFDALTEGLDLLVAEFLHQQEIEYAGEVFSGLLEGFMPPNDLVSQGGVQFVLQPYPVEVPEPVTD